ncbi:hypothetical protein [Serratia surfactantfaciens]|uniref:hypothetical protein n=1 Tax=Serratia surfactantfaciens TaxID=2741499 RepID=UPI001B3C82CE|nr:hypothetical protein [Serratia surfactantfaciens]
MMFPTDILRAALCCVANENEPREYLQGVYITPTHIHATDGRAAVMMEHGADTDIDKVFLVKGDIPDSAEATIIKHMDEGWMAIHSDEDKEFVGFCELVPLDCRYPDFSKILPAEPEPCDVLPMFSGHLLALPYLMFGSEIGFAAVQFKPSGKGGPCQLILDPGINRLYGNPFLVIMPLRDNTFDLLDEVMNEEGI